jgi:flagellar basal body P-ring formation protein FlgA
MTRWITILIAMLTWTGSSLAWDLALPDSVVVQGPVVRLGDVATGAIPTAVKGLQIQNQRRPGTVESISRRTILRQLVSNGLAAGVRFRGSETCRIFTSGQEIPATDLTREILSLLEDLIPSSHPGAPESWIEIQVPDLPICLSENPLVHVRGAKALEPGRNQVRVAIESANQVQEVPVSVVLHTFAETAVVSRNIERDQPLDAEMFHWEWKDLALESGEYALNRNAVLGFSSARSLKAGQGLKSTDLKQTPLVRVGDPVELTIFRGSVTATVRAFARQAGCLGQTIPVRNELTGRLVNARVAGAGLVEWRK